MVWPPSGRLADVVGMSAALFDVRGEVFASVIAGGPASRMTETKIACCVRLVTALGGKLQAHFRKFT